MKSLPRAPYCTYRPPFSSPSVPTPDPPCTHQPFPMSRFATAPSLTPSRWKNRDESASAVDPAILPFLESVPIRLLPLLPPSQESPASGLSSSYPASNAAPPPPYPITKPAVSAESAASPLPSGINSPSICSSLTVTPPHSPIVQQQTPTRQRPNFTFLPLLPVREEPKVITLPQTLPRPPPAKKFNMTFVPLLPPEPPAMPAADAAVELTPQSETPPGDDQQESAGEPELVNSPPPIFVPLNISRSSSSTPSLSSAASDTDTESETPSVSSPLPSSPSEDDAALSNYFDPRPHVDSSESLFGTINPYFPVLPAHPAIHPRESLSAKKSKLAALPSPALPPPSPLSLNSPSGPAMPHSTIGRRKFVARQSAFCSYRDESAGEVLSQRLTTLSATTTPGTPELTIESLRMAALSQPPPVEVEGMLGPSIRRREL